MSSAAPLVDTEDYSTPAAPQLACLQRVDSTASISSSVSLSVRSSCTDWTGPFTAAQPGRTRCKGSGARRSASHGSQPKRRAVGNSSLKRQAQKGGVDGESVLRATRELSAWDLAWRGDYGPRARMKQGWAVTPATPTNAGKIQGSGGIGLREERISDDSSEVDAYAGGEAAGSGEIQGFQGDDPNNCSENDSPRVSAASGARAQGAVASENGTRQLGSDRVAARMRSSKAQLLLDIDKIGADLDLLQSEYASILDPKKRSCSELLSRQRQCREVRGGIEA